MAIKVRKRGSSWQYDIHIRWPEGGEYRERKNAPTTARSAAQRWAEAREAALLASGKAALEVTPALKAPLLKDFWPQVVQDHYKAKRKKPSTIDAAQTVFKCHLTGLHEKRLDQVSNLDVARLKGKLAAKSPKTVNNILSVLSRVLNCAVEWGVIQSLPCKIELLPKNEPVMAWYEVHVYRRIVEAARKIGTGHLVLVLLAGSAGLRRGEIRALKWSDVDLERRMITVRTALWRKEENTPKGGRKRQVPMTPELAAALKAHKHLMGDRVLYTRLGREMSNRTIRNWMGVVLRRAGVATETDGKNPRDCGAIHILRHTFCSHLAIAGVPAKAIQELAGHADLSTTLKYMHLAEGDKTRAMGVLANYYTGEQKNVASRTS